MTIGQRIAELRKQNAMSQEALGEALGVTRQSISKWESDTALPEIEKLVALSRLFGVSIGALLGVEEAQEPAGQTAPETEGELTEAQLRMVEEIVARYTAALRQETTRQSTKTQQTPEEAKAAKRKKLRIAVACTALGGVAALLLFQRLDKLNQNYRNLESSLNFMRSDVNSQISSITSRVENILNEQNMLTADYGCTIAAVDPAAMTVAFDVYAVPKTYEAGMQVEFVGANSGASIVGTNNGDSVNALGQEGGNARFSARLVCPVAEAQCITVSAAFTRGGVRETQMLDVFDWLYDVMMPDVSVSSFLHMEDAVQAGVPFPIAGERVLVDVWQYNAKELPYVAEAPRAESLRVGLFVNKKLVVWAEMDEGGRQPITGVDAAIGTTYGVALNEAGSYTFTFPDYALTAQEGDHVCVAAVVVDQYGNERVFTDRVFLVSAGSGYMQYVAPEIYAQEGWEY